MCISTLFNLLVHENAWIQSLACYKRPFSSTFALLVVINVTIKLGIPMSMGVLSQVILLLVEIVCFEKSLIFTRGVMLHAVKHH